MTPVAAAAVLALVVTVGLWAVVDAAAPGTSLRARPPWVPDGRRLAAGLMAGAAVGAVTRWPVAAVAAAAAGVWSNRLWGSAEPMRALIDRTDALAGWLEQVRDGLRSGAGLADAVRGSASAAPLAIRDDVLLLGTRLELKPPAEAFAEFAADVAHPMTDLVAIALTVAEQRGVAGLSDLFDELAGSTRDEARVYRRVHAEQRRLIRIERTMIVFIALFAGWLMLSNRAYLAAYDSAVGQLVLAGVIGGAVLSLRWLRRLAAIELPDRFFLATPGDSR